MLIVNSSGEGAFSFLQHSEFLAHNNQITFADTIFPTFLLCTGFSSSLAPRSHLRLVRRTLGLVFFGCLYNAVRSLLAGQPFRPLGILQRIGVSSYIVSAWPFNRTALPILAFVAWYIATYAGSSGCSNESVYMPPECTAQSRLDIWMFGANRLYKPEYDPEGVLGTITTSLVTVSAGQLLNYAIVKYRAPLMSYWRGPKMIWHFYGRFIGLLLVLIPIPWLLVRFANTPVSKPLWTPPYVFETVIISAAFWLMTAIVDHYPQLVTGTGILNSLLATLEVMGQRSLEIYLGGEILQEFGKKKIK